MKTPSKTGNKFAAILQARQDPAAEEQELAPVTGNVAASTTPLAALPRAEIPTPARQRTPIVPVLENHRAGRPPGKGKSSDPSFRQVTAYIPQDLHNNATIALRLANQIKIDVEKEDFSELLTRLLANWYEQQAYYRPGK